MAGGTSSGGSVQNSADTWQNGGLTIGYPTQKFTPKHGTTPHGKLFFDDCLLATNGYSVFTLESGYTHPP